MLRPWQIASLLVLSLMWSGCVSTGVKQRRHKPRAQAPRSSAPVVVRHKLIVVNPTEPKSSYFHWDGNASTLFREFGQRIVLQGEHLRQRAQLLHRRCNQRGAPASLCRVYWRSQRIFAINYRTRPSLYRGYMMFHWRNKRRIPRRLMRWHRRLAQSKYEAKGRCYLDRGHATSCMGFSMCAQRGAVRRFSGRWGSGFSYPTWGYVNYWTNRAYQSVMSDYRVRGQRRLGVRSYLRRSASWTPSLRKARARRLLKDMHGRFMRIVRRKLRNKWNRRLYRKLFCTNIVAGTGSFRRALPGDMFVIAYLQKRRKWQRSISNIRHQHWGVVVDPTSGRILHNQTPGGIWGRKFHRWGIQYGKYAEKFMTSKWKYHRRRRRYERRMFFLNRLNVHYFVFARIQKRKIYNSSKPSLCEEWIDKHADIYFQNMAPSHDSPTLVSLAQP